SRHLVQFVARRLDAANFQGGESPSGFESDSSAIYSAQRGYITRNGAIVAWSIPSQGIRDGIRIIGAHSDSPGLHLKPLPDHSSASWRQLGVEIYGSPLLNSWLDRDLGIAGYVVLTGGRIANFCYGTPIARISQLAIHLDRDVNERGLVLDKQQHLVPTWATTPGANFQSWIAKICEVTSQQIVSIHAQFFDTQPSAIVGVDESMLASARLDNQVSCWAAVEALLEMHGDNPSIVVIFDHEEVGSQSTSGAAGPMLEHVIERVSLSAGLSRSQYLEMLTRSHCVSADNAHAFHPNYPDRHDSQHLPLLNGGPVIKFNSNQRYASSAQSVAPFMSACLARQIPTQTFVSRNNLPCGSTIGPITATRLGIETIDVGVAQLSMHSIREVCGIRDPSMMATALEAYLSRS
ncbi:MAG: M18 family aminopeptidase, partial [Ilumatobacteraceae bacterium]